MGVVIMKSIQISYDNDFAKKCRFAAEAGFTHIAVGFSAMEDYSDDAFQKAPEKILSILNENNLKTIQSHAPYYDLLVSAEITDEETERRFIRSIETSGKLGVKWCVIHPRTYVTGGYNKEKSFNESVKTISKYLEYAQKYNTGIAVENLMSWGNNPRTIIYGSEYKELAELCDEFNSERLKICWDFGHANIMRNEFSQQEAIKFLGERIKCTHIHNNYGDRDYHLPPDAGNIDWQSAMKALKEINYSGPFTLETHCLYPEDGMLRDFARYNYNCLEFLERLFK